MFGVSIGDQGGIKGAAGALYSDDRPVTHNLNSILLSDKDKGSTRSLSDKI